RRVPDLDEGFPVLARKERGQASAVGVPRRRRGGVRRQREPFGSRGRVPYFDGLAAVDRKTLPVGAEWLCERNFEFPVRDEPGNFSAAGGVPDLDFRLRRGSPARQAAHGGEEVSL